MPENDFDFGFTFSDDDMPSSSQIQQPINDEFKDELMLKIASLEEKLEFLTQGDTTELIQQHKELLTQEVRSKLKQVENLILPLLYNLQKNPDKEYIHWPNRKEIIQKQIQKILEVTKYYG
jgi:hypothetical protein